MYTLPTCTINCKDCVVCMECSYGTLPVEALFLCLDLFTGPFRKAPCVVSVMLHDKTCKFEEYLYLNEERDHSPIWHSMCSYYIYITLLANYY